MTPPMYPSVCPTCGRELQYIGQYSMWYCHSCRGYKVPAPPAAPPQRMPVAPGQAPGYQQAPAQSAPYTQPSPEPIHIFIEVPVSQPAEKPGPACPSCGKDIQYVEQYRRWYCYGCSQYAPESFRP